MRIDEQNLLELRCKLEKFITKREAMIIANKAREGQNPAYVYGNAAFFEVMKDIEDLENHIVWLGNK